MPATVSQSVTECLTAFSNDAEGGMITSPLWAGDVTIRGVGQGNDPDSVFPEGNVGFVHEDDDIQVRFTIVNRIPDGTPETAQASAACETLQEVFQDMTNLRIRFRYPESDRAAERDAWSIVPGVNCLGNLDEYNGRCTVSHIFTIAPGPGEHRLLYVIGNQPPGESFHPLLGIERVVIVDGRPDLVASVLDWVDPPEPERVTVYGAEALSDFRLTIANNGAYPYWNPNGGLRYCGWPSFDGNDPDNKPDGQDASKGCRYAGDGELLPYCNDDAFWGNGYVGGAPDTGDLICSYKRGFPLTMPVDYLVTKEGAGVAEAGLHPSAAFWGSPEDNLLDKADAIAPGVADNANCPEVLAPPPGKCFVLSMFDRNRKAGDFDFRMNVGQGVAPHADRSLGNNVIETEFEVYGVDLRWAGAAVLVQDAPGCGVSAATACPAGAEVTILDARYRNAGDEEADDDGGVLNRHFKAAIYVNGIRDDATIEEILAPLPQTDDDAATVWDGAQVLTDPDGGLHTIELRLDHPDNYAGDQPPLLHADGMVSERREGNACPAPGAAADNVWCVTLYFDEA